MSLLVVGSVALDSVETPLGKVEEALGGSATYFSAAASLLTGVRMVAVVGNDFPDQHVEMLSSRGIDLEGLEREEGRTFRWSGRYSFDLNQAITLDTQLNVFERFDPKLPAGYRDSEFVFLANIHPALQLKVLEQTEERKFAGADTMNFWIEGEREILEKVFRRVDCVTINEAEARDFTGESNLFRAAGRIAELGPAYIVIKRGEYGALLWHEEEVFFAPAYPLEEVADPTGAGDTFAGGFFGYLSSRGKHDPETVKQGIVVGSVAASFNVEDFSLRRLIEITTEDISDRVERFGRMIRFDTDSVILS
jgi:sugar/nucleoside kinase (ribokinase family)